MRSLNLSGSKIQQNLKGARPLIIFCQNTWMAGLKFLRIFRRSVLQACKNLLRARV